MIRAELILDTRTKSKKGYPVKIRVYDNINQKHKYIALKIYQENSELKFDSFLRKRASDLDDEVKFCNDNLYAIDDAIDVISNGIPLSKDEIDIEIELLEKRLEILRAKKGIKHSIGFIAFTDVLISERKKLKLPSVSYTSTKNAVKRFLENKEDVPLNEITSEWIKDFDLFYKDLGTKDSSIHTYITVLKAIFTEAQSRESLNIKKENPFYRLRNFKRIKKESELTIQDLISMYNLDTSKVKENIKRSIDIYLFQFSIGGHDLIDVANLKWSNIKDGRIVFKRYKNRFKKYEGEEVNNMLSDFALRVIEKYGDVNSKRIFSFIPDPETDIVKYRYFNNTTNISTFKIVKKIINSENNFTTKSTRYLFRTIGGNLLIDSYIMMLLQGHTPQGITFGYQGAINHEVQDKEHQKILDLVFVNDVKMD